MLSRLDRLTLTWWFPHALLLALAVGITLAAALLTPSAEAVSVLGVDVPVVCGWRRATGLPCMGCGLTRSFTFMAHGRIREAFEMNWLGPVLFLLLAGQIPWRAVRLWRGPPSPPVPVPTP